MEHKIEEYFDGKDKLEKLITYNVDGSIYCEEYYLNKGKRHRSDGPAYKQYYEDGSVQYEEYWLNNECHRTDGPALREYNEDGSVNFDKYLLNDVELNKKIANTELSRKTFPNHIVDGNYLIIKE